MTRTSYVRGPAKIDFGGKTFQSRGDIKVAFKEETFEIATDLNGPFTKRLKERIVEVTFTPVGSMVDWGAATLLWPLSGQPTFVGNELFASYAGGMAGVPVDQDLPLVITGRDAALYGPLTFKSAMVTKMPDVILSTQATLVGAVTLTCIGVSNQAWNYVSGLWSIGAPAAWSGPAAPVIPTQPYNVAWGAVAPWNAIETADGVHASFDMQIEPWGTDSNGIQGFTIKGLAVTARLQPRNITKENLLNLFDGTLNAGGSLGPLGALMQGPLGYRGMDITTSAVLTVTPAYASPGGVSLRINDAALMMPGLDYGSATARIPELEFVANLQTPGTDSFFTIGTGT